jgi:hypothetical protein
MPQEPLPADTPTKPSGILFVDESENVARQTSISGFASLSHNSSYLDARKKSFYNEVNKNNKINFISSSEAKAISNVKTSTSLAGGAINEMRTENNTRAMSGTYNLAQSSFSGSCASSGSQTMNCIKSGTVNHAVTDWDTNSNIISSNISGHYFISEDTINNNSIIGKVYLPNELGHQLCSTLQRNIFGCYLYYGRDNIVIKIS